MATRMFAALQEDSELANAALEAHTEELLKDERRCVALVAKAAKNRGMSASDQRGAIVQMQHAARALAAAGDDQAATYRAVRAFLHGPRSRSKAARDKLGELKVVPVVAGPRTFQGGSRALGRASTTTRSVSVTAYWMCWNVGTLAGSWALAWCATSGRRGGSGTSGRSEERP